MKIIDLADVLGAQGDLRSYQERRGFLTGLRRVLVHGGPPTMLGVATAALESLDEAARIRQQLTELIATMERSAAGLAARVDAAIKILTKKRGQLDAARHGLAALRGESAS